MSQTSLQDLIAGCQNERKSYRSDDDSRSPSCAEIFRRAFANDQEAWTAVHELFKPLFTSWGYRFSTVYDLQQEYQEDALQVSWDLFCKNAPKRATSLLVDNTIGRALEYMQTIVRREVLRIARRRPRNEMSIFTNDDEHPTLEIEEPLTTEQKAEARIVLDTVLQRIFAILEGEQELIVFKQRWLLRVKAAEIYEQFRYLFKDEKEIYQITQRVDRKIMRDEELSKTRRSLFGPRKNEEDDTSLRIETNDQQDVPRMDGSCSLEESQLLDYVLGVATQELRAAVERSPACLGEVQRLAIEVQQFERLLFRAECPDSDMLVDYQEKQLDSTAHLVVFRHVQTCAACQKDVEALVAIDSVPLERSPGLLRRLTEALFQSALSQPFAARGGGMYHTPQIQIDVSTDMSPDELRSWTVYGEVRSSDGARLPNLVEEVTLERLDSPDAQISAAQVDADGSFVLESITEGTYRLRILTPEEEIYIRSVVIGDDV